MIRSEIKITLNTDKDQSGSEVQSKPGGEEMEDGPLRMSEDDDFDPDVLVAYNSIDGPEGTATVDNTLESQASSRQDSHDLQRFSEDNSGCDFNPDVLVKNTEESVYRKCLEIAREEANKLVEALDESQDEVKGGDSHETQVSEGTGNIVEDEEDRDEEEGEGTTRKEFKDQQVGTMGDDLQQFDIAEGNEDTALVEQGGPGVVDAAKGQISSQEDLNKFISRHTDGSFICDICNKSMKRRDNLRTHVEDQHFRDLFSYPCPDCPMILGSKKTFYNHKQYAHKKCDVSFYSDSNNNQDEPDIDLEGKEVEANHSRMLSIPQKEKSRSSSLSSKSGGNFCFKQSLVSKGLLWEEVVNDGNSPAKSFKSLKVNINSNEVRLAKDALAKLKRECLD